MTIYSSERKLAPSIKAGINHALGGKLKHPAEGVLPMLLDGSAKVLVIEWNGDLANAYEDCFDPARGDGQLHVLRPWESAYQVPSQFDYYFAVQKAAMQDAGKGDAAVDPNAVPWNIRATVPLWVLGRPDNRGSRTVIASGGYHPRWAGATLDFFCPYGGQVLIRLYFSDVDTDHTMPGEDYVPSAQQTAWINEAGGQVWRYDGRGPVFQSTLV